jgi:probable HAF family extracellular repeat protein
MNPRTNPLSLYLSRASCMVAFALASASLAADRPAYTITELRPPPGSIGIEPTKINHRGDIIGFTEDADRDDHPFLYRNGAIQELLPSVMTANATDINNAGQITCFVLAPPSGYAALISPDGTVVNLNELLRGFVYPTAINDVGDMIYGGINGPGVYNFVSGTTRHVEEPAVSELIDIKNRGQVIGYYFSEDHSSSTGALFDGPRVTQFHFPRYAYTLPIAMNNRGQVIGVAYDEIPGSYLLTPFSYEEHHFKHLGFLPGDDSAAPIGINDSGELVGWSAGENLRAFLYSNHKMYDLKALVSANAGWTLEIAFSINGQGQIVGIGTLDGAQRGFLLTPIAPDKK